MNILSETYIFYADIYLIQNLIIKVAVLYLSLYCNKFYRVLFTVRGFIKICIIAFIGTIFEIVGLLFGSSYNVFIMMVYLLEVPLMFLGVLEQERRQLFRVIVTGYFFVVVINGVVEVLWNYFGENASFILLLFFACGMVFVVVCIWQNYSKMQKGIFTVELFHESKKVDAYGFYDSGNRLKDTYTGKGVHIVSKGVFHSLGLETDLPVLLPYQSLGNEEGILEVYYVDKIIIEGEKQRKSWHKCPLGVTKDNLFEGKNYEIILNEEVF